MCKQKTLHEQKSKFKHTRQHAWNTCGHDPETKRNKHSRCTATGWRKLDGWTWWVDRIATGGEMGAGWMEMLDGRMDGRMERTTKSRTLPNQQQPQLGTQTIPNNAINTAKTTSKCNSNTQCMTIPNTQKNERFTQPAKKHRIHRITTNPPKQTK